MDVIVDGVDLDTLNYTVLVPYNGTIPTGGDSLTQNLNIWYEVCSFLSQRLCVAASGLTPQYSRAMWRG